MVVAAGDLVIRYSTLTRLAMSSLRRCRPFDLVDETTELLDNSNAGAGRRRRVCACGCRQPLPKATKRRKYASPACRQRHYRERQQG